MSINLPSTGRTGLVNTVPCVPESSLYSQLLATWSLILGCFWAREYTADHCTRMVAMHHYLREMVTAALADLVESTTLTAVTVTVAGEGTEPGVL